MIKHLLGSFLILSTCCTSSAQPDPAKSSDSTANQYFRQEAHPSIHPVTATVESGLTSTSERHVPFWMRANQFGNVPLAGNSGYIVLRSTKAYTPKRKLTDWGYAFEGRANTGVRDQFILTEAYVKGKLGVLEFRAGRSRQISGLTDSTLSSGSFAVSGNALGIPKLEIAMPDYSNLHILGQFIAVKGNLAHGWLGTMAVNQIREKLNPAKTYFHQKSLYIRLGRSTGRVRLYGGFNHQVFWGNERIVYGQRFRVSVFDSYYYVFTGKTMEAKINGFEKGKMGNHLGSVDMGGDVRIGRTRIFVYRQNFYDVGALAKLANIKDGLNGFSITNLSTDNRTFQWKKILVEFLYTKSQAGELNARYTKSGDENYYNGFYKEGWSYKGVGLGTPFISTVKTTRRNLPNDPRDYFNNNRVAMLHLATEVKVAGFLVQGRLSCSENFGTYGTSPDGHSRGKIRRQSYGLFPVSRQLSGALDLKKKVKENTELACVVAFDRGQLLRNAVGATFGIKKVIR
ncbi:capsule assembly Wzi family protein [Dyadobacter sandarakinus]|uniref:Capsule assembly protein Wzi n=1 Tax=Dyadobacter sandarakinus TaxID=2747268 RepID=A0ABX7I0C5_9BACT|nr:capsule assembly Wzi family protein [Dyadobacter sandarakinus]QRQ99455.1 hypothetical protein HWI92_00280 [Dyadobacter sandarakinus]